jgi:hypothetical protein
MSEEAHHARTSAWLEWTRNLVQLSYRIGQRYVSRLIKVQPFTKSELGTRLRRIEQKYGREH